MFSATALLPLLKKAWPLLLAVAVYFGGYYMGKRQATLEYKATQADLKVDLKDNQDKEDKRQDKIATEFETDQAERKVRTETIIKEIVREVHVPIKLGCDVPVPPSLLRNLNEIRGHTYQEAAGEPSSPLRATTEAGGG